jgi:hypothetical protein
MNANVLTAGKFPRYVERHTVVLFDGRTGDIHHVHCALLFGGAGPRPSQAELETVARRNAAHRRRKGPPPTLEALHITKSDPGFGVGPQRVDIATRKIVPRPSP